MRHLARSLSRILERTLTRSLGLCGLLAALALGAQAQSAPASPVTVDPQGPGRAVI